MIKKNITVLVSGRFNILHPGHLRLFKSAKDYGDYLIVAVESDRLAKKNAYVNEKLRLEGVRSNNFVDDAFIYDKSLVDIIDKIQPNIIIKGKEFEKQFNQELEAVKKYGGRLVFSSGESIFSSVDLIRNEFESSRLRLPDDLESYKARHKITKSSLIAILKKFSKIKVCVIGDLIVDEYITCEPLGMSQEDPTIVVTPIDSRSFLGGAGIVAAHSSSLGAKTSFFSISGKDASRSFALEKLIFSGVQAQIVIDEARPTTLKKRYRGKGKTLLRVSHLHCEAISVKLQRQILRKIKKVLPQTNLLVFSDFNYGCLPQSLVNEIILLSKNFNILVAADSQSSSQIGNISRFRNVDLLCPTEREARISTRNYEDGLVMLAEHLRKDSNVKNILLKLGEEGLLIHTSTETDQNWLTDRVSALNNSPKDVAGAGDSLLIVSAMTLACGGNIWEASYLGSLAAAIQVGRVGNTPLLIQELIESIK